MTQKAVATAFLLAGVAAFFSMPVCAKEKDLGHFGAWRATSATEGGQIVCYMTTTKILKPTVVKRAQPYLMITHRPVEASTDVVSYGAGAVLDTRRSPEMHIGQASFELFSVRDNAWARDALTDHKIAKAILGVSTVQLYSFLTHKGGPKMLADTFDVTGAGDAYHSIGKACGLSTGTFKAQKKKMSKHKVRFRRTK